MALAECCLGARLGARVALEAVPVAAGAGAESERLLFSETPSRFLVSVAPARRARWERTMAGTATALVGNVVADPVVHLTRAGAELAQVTVEEIHRSWGGAS